MEEIRFGYRLPVNKYVMIGLIPISLLFGIGSQGIWYVTDNPFYLLLPFGIFGISVLISFVLSKRHFLVINKEGISLNYMFRRREFVSWDTIDGFMYLEMGKNNKGWVITYKEDAEVEQDACALFIPENNVSTTKETINEALNRGFQENVWHRNEYQDSFNNSVKINKGVFVFYALCIVCIAFATSYFYLDHIWTPSNLRPIMEWTLVGGEQFNVNAHLIFIFIPWMVLGGFFMFIPLFIPLHILKKEQTGSLKAKPGCLWLCGVLIVGILLAASYSLLRKRKVYLNCSEPITNPIETVDAKVKRNGYESHRDPYYHYYFFVDFDLTYEGGKYKVRLSKSVKYENINDVLKGKAITPKNAYKGMPAVVKLQKGARGLPIVHEVAIPEIGWSVNLLGEAYNKISYEYLKKGQIDKAIETIDKAIALAPNVANYYDSKGEFLFRKGDKEGALEMWIKVISLDPDFDQKHDSYLSRQMYN